MALTPDDGLVFLTNVGLAFEPNRLTQLVRHYVDAAELAPDKAELAAKLDAEAAEDAEE